MCVGMGAPICICLQAEAAEPSRSWLQRVASWFGSLSTGDEALEAPQEVGSTPGVPLRHQHSQPLHLGRHVWAHQSCTTLRDTCCLLAFIYWNAYEM